MTNVVAGHQQALWNSCVGHFQAALVYEHRPITLEMVRDDYMAGKFAILRSVRSALLVDLVNIDGQHHLRAYLGGGELTEMVDVLFPRAESLARSFGCHSVLIDGRKGWARALRGHGYSVTKKGDGWWLTAKQLFPKPFKERFKPMTAINYCVGPSFVAIATDTLITDLGDWAPYSLTAKASFIPQLGAVITGTAFYDIVKNCFNFALTAPVRDIIGLADHLPGICRQTFREAMALAQSQHPPDEDFSWTESCAVSLFGWSDKHRRLVGLRFAYENDFEPRLIFDGVFTHPHMPGCPGSIASEDVHLLVDITRQQQEREMRRTPTDRNAIGGDVLLWQLRATPDGRVVSSVERVHRFDTYDADMDIIKAKHARAMTVPVQASPL